MKSSFYLGSYMHYCLSVMRHKVATYKVNMGSTNSLGMFQALSQLEFGSDTL